MHWWTENWQGKLKYSDKSGSHFTFSIINPSLTDLRLNPSHPGKNPNDNRLSTALRRYKPNMYLLFGQRNAAARFYPDVNFPVTYYFEASVSIKEQTPVTHTHIQAHNLCLSYSLPTSHWPLFLLDIIISWYCVTNSREMRLRYPRHDARSPDRDAELAVGLLGNMLPLFARRCVPHI
jgi:hypothetical protein